MKRRKALSLLLILTILLSLVLPATSALADDDTNNEGETKTSGLSINKTAEYDAENDAYTITLEAYATGEKTTTTISKDVPTDIILVLDQSGSMSNAIGAVSFKKYENESNYLGTTYHTRNQDYYEYRHNGGSSNLWHKLDDDSYVSVSVTKQENFSYTQITNGKNGSSYNATSYWDHKDFLRALVNGEYLKVTVTRTNWNGTYTYTLPGGTVIATSTKYTSSPTFTGIEGDHIYLATVDDATTTYTYAYTDAAGSVQTIGTSTGAENTRYDGNSNIIFYQRNIDTNAGGAKLNALKTAITSFVNSVNQKSLGADGQYGTADDVAHRIAIVGFASNGRNQNTELLSTQNATDYWSASDANYRDALVPACGTNGAVNSRLSTAINLLAASGDTYLEYGMDMANKIFAQYPITAEDTSGRQRVVIVFTDGYPAPNGTDDFNYSMADNAISNANVTKQTYGATVYTVGLFNTADPTADIVTNFATTDGWYDGWESSGNSLTDQQEAVAANRYMHYVSSNYPGAANLNQGGSLNPNANPFAGGTSYYLSAADAGSLNNIFQQISSNIEDGGSSTTLTDSTVIRDIVAEAFTMPENTTDVKVYTEDSDGNVNSWTNRQELKLADGSSPVSIDAVNRIVSVTGFSYKDNWCGNETVNGQTSFHNGKKLIIEFTVKAKAGFLGGNDVFTNDGAGIYENAESKDPLMEFNKPTVNVPIGDVGVTATDKNVYLLGGVTLDDLKKGTTVTVGDDIKLNLSQANNADKPYGLEPWQTAYVNIIVEYKDGDKVLTELTDLKDDVTYTVEVAVAPKTTAPTSTQGETAVAKTGVNDPAANIYVFKPELTYKDSEAYYGDVAPTDYSGNLVSTEWKHDETLSTTVTMTGDEPTLEMTYTPEAGKINSLNKIDTKQDIGVDVKVEISKADAAGTTTKTDVTDKTTFVHQACESDCGWTTPENPGDPAFLIHVKTCTLTITKTGEVQAKEPFVFTVYKDGNAYTEVTIVGAGSVTIAELSVGTYSITENENWSWRYAPEYSNGKEVTLNATTHEGTILCKNTKDNDKWLDGYSDVISNIFQLKQPTTDTGDTN